MESRLFEDLEAYAKELIRAHLYPTDQHLFRMSNCSYCGLMPFQLIVVHHRGSREGDFKGQILGVCSGCASPATLLSFTGAHRKPTRREEPACRCGGREFFVGECERIEGKDGLSGFFDEGVIVAKCSRCGENRELARTD